MSLYLGTTCSILLAIETLCVHIKFQKLILTNYVQNNLSYPGTLGPGGARIFESARNLESSFQNVCNCRHVGFTFYKANLYDSPPIFRPSIIFVSLHCTFLILPGLVTLTSIIAVELELTHTHIPVAPPLVIALLDQLVEVPVSWSLESEALLHIIHAM